VVMMMVMALVSIAGIVIVA